MNYSILLFVAASLALTFNFTSSRAESEHSHDEHEHEAQDSEKGHTHEESDGHGHQGGGDNVGPDKGILEASGEDGIKLSKEAISNFDIKAQKLSGQGPWSIPISARLQSGEEINIYRVRGDFYKRIDFVTITKSETILTVRGPELKDGDQIVVKGVGFLRIAELAAFGGAPEGHSH